ncbi:MAG: hypothetical protein ABH950_07410 [Candidatus Altiarchaeota archaeon]
MGSGTTRALWLGLALVTLSLLMLTDVSGAIRHQYKMVVEITQVDGNELNATDFCVNSTLELNFTDDNSDRPLDEAKTSVYYGRKKIDNLESERDGLAYFTPELVGDYTFISYRDDYRDTEQTIFVLDCLFPGENMTSSENESLKIDNGSSMVLENDSIAENITDPVETGNEVNHSEQNMSEETTITLPETTTSSSATTVEPVETSTSSTFPTSISIPPKPTSSIEEKPLLVVKEPKIPLSLFLLVIVFIGALLVLYFGILQFRKEERNSKLGGKPKTLESKVKKGKKSKLGK